MEKKNITKQNINAKNYANKLFKSIISKIIFMIMLRNNNTFSLKLLYNLPYQI